LLVDSHAHLDNPRYTEDREAMLARAYEAGVRAVLSIGIGDGPEQMHQAWEISRKYSRQPGMPRILASAGIYPHEGEKATAEALHKLDGLLAEPEVIACGEIGLDYFHEGTPHDLQKRVFSQQMEIAARRKRPIIIHCRPSQDSDDAWNDTLDTLESEWKQTGLGGILHCFSGSWDHARRGMDLGFLLSFAGNITFPKAQSIRDVAVKIPLDNMLLETDSPYLAPTPNRGKRNEPAWVVEVARQIAKEKGLEPEVVASSTTNNFCRLFDLTPDTTADSDRFLMADIKNEK
jgi:TatD DNase family protein